MTICKKTESHILQSLSAHEGIKQLLFEHPDNGHVLLGNPSDSFYLNTESDSNYTQHWKNKQNNSLHSLSENADSESLSLGHSVRKWMVKVLDKHTGTQTVS